MSNVITNSLRKTISQSNVKTLGGYNNASKLLEPKKLSKLPKLEMPEAPKPKRLDLVSKINPKISKAPSVAPPKAKAIYKLSKEEAWLEKIAEKIEEKNKKKSGKIPGTSSWIREMLEG